MKSELFSTAALIILCFNACCEGIKLTLNRDIQMPIGSRITCGILLCEEKLPPKNTPSSSIFNMTVFKNQPSCSRTSEVKSETRVVVASINSEHPNFSHITDATQVIGILGSRNASLRIEMFRHDDCNSDFTCEVQGLDIRGRRVFLSSTKILQQQGDKNMGYDILTSALSEVKDKFVLVQDEFEAAFAGIRNQVQSLENRMNSLENRMENKINAKLSVVNKDDTHDQNGDALDKTLSSFKQELNDVRENAAASIIDYFDARLFSHQTQLIHKLRDPISEMISANDKTLKDAFNITSSQKLSQDAFEKMQSFISNSTTEPQSALDVTYRKLSHMGRSMVSNLKSSMVDIIQPSTCKRGMIRPPCSYPYPHPVIYPRDESGQGLPYLCDMFTDGGGWIVFQRRSTGKVDFYRNWETYKKGFGTFDDEFWLGNERIHAFTSSGTWELRVDLQYKGKEAYALYSNFKVENESKQYTLRIGNYRGTAGDSLDFHNGRKFTTHDRDNDLAETSNCSVTQQSGWWYNDCDTADLNSIMNGKYDRGLEWNSLANSESCSFSEMKMRRVG
ncbi:ficolin-1 [Plakobranchus ocellatus]|uniref:Ficolin-1 n=1 Tax=Plakobranchus ocellatus TaxID=259542 RepID=A0AAV4AC88_9GAST|nr:ficolin-1 [Plakobranchus ocellatus]